MYDCGTDTQMMHADGMMGGGWLMMLISALIVLALIGAVVVGVVWLVRSTSTAQGASPPTVDQAETLLRNRFANGEISAEEYRERLAQLRS